MAKMRAKVQSFSNPELFYTVVVTGRKLTGHATCSCPAWIYSGHSKDCKHIKSVRKLGVFKGGSKEVVLKARELMSV